VSAGDRFVRCGNSAKTGIIGTEGVDGRLCGAYNDCGDRRCMMLVIARLAEQRNLQGGGRYFARTSKKSEVILKHGDVEISVRVISVSEGGRVRLGISAPEEVIILRSDVVGGTDAKD
jgi:sRNA-binding carbon storage regulator CsrA